MSILLDIPNKLNRRSDLVLREREAIVNSTLKSGLKYRIIAASYYATQETVVQACPPMSPLDPNRTLANVCSEASWLA